MSTSPEAANQRGRGRAGDRSAQPYSLSLPLGSGQFYRWLLGLGRYNHGSKTLTFKAIHQSPVFTAESLHSFLILNFLHDVPLREKFVQQPQEHLVYRVPRFQCKSPKCHDLEMVQLWGSCQSCRKLPAWKTCVTTPTRGDIPSWPANILTHCQLSPDTARGPLAGITRSPVTKPHPLPARHPSLRPQSRIPFLLHLRLRYHQRKLQLGD